MTGYGLHPEALADLDEIWGFIAADSIDSADRVIAEILKEISELTVFPERGFVRPEITSRPLRFIAVYEYLIAYAPEERPLWVFAVIHGRRNPRVMAAALRGRE
jgi:toxin ParE1/3/4